jgi:hypothetical protein
LPMMNELIMHDESGWLLDPWRAATKVPAQLDELAEDRERVLQVGKASRQLVRERFPRSKWIDQMAQLLAPRGAG